MDTVEHKTEKSSMGAALQEWFSESIQAFGRALFSFIIAALIASFGSPILVIGYLIGIVPNAFNVVLCGATGAFMLLVIPLQTIVFLGLIMAGQRLDYDRWWSFAVINWMRDRHSFNPFSKDG